MRLRWKPPFLVALSAGFSFQEKGISDDEIIAEKSIPLHMDETGDWELVAEQDEYRVLRRPFGDENTGLYEYRCTGTYNDITPRDFVDTQIDLEYRQKWDSNVLKLELLYDDKESDSQVIRWIHKFPYPMYPREYIYVRRRYVDEEDRSVVIASSALDESLLPSSNSFVRVQTYRSVMVVRAHHSFDEMGLDYVLTYYDNPESNIPSYAYNWVINRGGPIFLQQVVHAAALELGKTRSESCLANNLAKKMDEIESKMSTANEAEFVSGAVGEGEGETGLEAEMRKEIENREIFDELAERAGLQGMPEGLKTLLKAWHDRLTSCETPEMLFD
ncbi:unnamed protein product [Anisakis simplex]|uniref:Phosphatidylcholine transfer protein n=1 Tax=Anisakis simplex TaxID=6269 RepID=A0A3P6NRA9_ANISI|nr:unnamed protein product [Anisakis simplex]